MKQNSTIDLPDEVDASVVRVLEEACARDLRLTAAESCTGGLLASILTDLPGCSHAFERGFVVYTDEAKQEMLGIPAPVLEEHGAVSKPTALAMAEGSLDRSRADIAVAITGFAGPAGDSNEEGLVHFACARRGRPTIHREAHYGAIGRGPIRVACLEAALEMLEEMLR